MAVSTCATEGGNLDISCTNTPGVFICAILLLVASNKRIGQHLRIEYICLFYELTEAY
jgi:hypothetical protein